MPKVTIFVSTIVLHNDKFLVVQEGKNNHNQLDTWNFPAGRVEAGESLIEAAIREAKEESGYDINIDGVLSVLFKNTKDGMDLIVFFNGHIINNSPINYESGIKKVDFVSFESLKKLDLRFHDDILIQANRALLNKIYPLDIIMDYQES
mgnify:FL=1